jgi:hypothetical protein
MGVGVKEDLLAALLCFFSLLFSLLKGRDVLVDVLVWEVRRVWVEAGRDRRRIS